MERLGVPSRKLAGFPSGLGATGFPVSKLLFIQMPQIPIWEWGVGGNQWQQLFMAQVNEAPPPLSPAPVGR